MTENPEGGITLSVIWPDVEKLTLQRANQFLGQLVPANDGMPEDIIITAGFVGPPVLLGSPEEQRASLGAIRAIAAQPLARLSMSRQRAAELSNLLAGLVAQYDVAHGQGGGQA